MDPYERGKLWLGALAIAAGTLVALVAIQSYRMHVTPIGDSFAVLHDSSTGTAWYFAGRRWLRMEQIDELPPPLTDEPPVRMRD